MVEVKRHNPTTDSLAGDKTQSQRTSHSCDRQTNIIEQSLLKLLVCPFTKQPLKYDKENAELISEAARLVFPVRHGVPILTREAARHLDQTSTRSGKLSG